MRLDSDQLRTLVQAAASPAGVFLRGLMEAELAETDVALRTADADQVMRLQGKAKCLVEWLERFEKAGENYARVVSRRIATPIDSTA